MLRSSHCAHNEPLKIFERPLHGTLRWALFPEFTLPMSLLTALQGGAAADKGVTGAAATRR